MLTFLVFRLPRECDRRRNEENGERQGRSEAHLAPLPDRSAKKTKIKMGITEPLNNVTLALSYALSVTSVTSSFAHSLTCL